MTPPARPTEWSSRGCRECGAKFQLQRASREFCCAACRRVFNNRRMLRGAEFYDLVMATRFDRSAAQQNGAWSLLCRMAASFRYADQRERDGRPSWDDVAKIKARHARVLATPIAPRGRSS